MSRNFLKINRTDYMMVSEPNETDQVMIDDGYTKVNDAQFDEAFNLYAKVMNGELKYNEVPEKLELLS
ncbi:hypothetical protein [Paenibacillus sp. 276b]|uniref:hypothetical protein n=1 Tax=Paenibacillus sp. 276b TaxID=1566277 RepID=UPI0008949BF1|nr:hypothetical protein [Paenibacillus sp. 276b]SEB27561.1 hypothetical protein SAMN03159332_6225 [Paenibacillus sp. 276b]